jgi:hypothetical protein
VHLLLNVVENIPRLILKVTWKDHTDASSSSSSDDDDDDNNNNNNNSSSSNNNSSDFAIQNTARKVLTPAT